jgi:hypothetical protein
VADNFLGSSSSALREALFEAAGGVAGKAFIRMVSDGRKYYSIPFIRDPLYYIFSYRHIDTYLLSRCLPGKGYVLLHRLCVGKKRLTVDFGFLALILQSLGEGSHLSFESLDFLCHILKSSFFLTVS